MTEVGARGSVLGAARYPRRSAGMTELARAGVTEVGMRVRVWGRAGVAGVGAWV